MAKFTKAELKKEYQRAKSLDWIPTFTAEADAKNFPTEILMGIASRETNMTNIKGDFRGGKYHGFSLMQIDIGSYPEWINAGTWHNPLEGIKKGAEVLADKRRQVANAAKAQKETLSGDMLQEIAIAAYNCGAGPAFKNYMDHLDPDRGTTGHDYSQDVLARAEVFKSFLEADAPETIDAETPPETDTPETTPNTAATKPADSGADGSPVPPQLEAATIPAVPPMPAQVPGALKRFFQWVGGLSVSSYLGSLVFFKDHPDVLLAILPMIKVVFFGLGGIGAVATVMYFLERRHNATLANDLNVVRYQNFANTGTHNVDFSGWKDTLDHSPPKGDWKGTS